MLRNRGLGVRGIQQAEVGQAVTEGNIKEAQRRAMQLSYANVRLEKAKIAQEKNPDKHSLEAVGILKQATDKEDKYLIYRINNSQFNDQPNYVFKSSAPMAQLAIDMDQNGPEHPLQTEDTYFDGCHSRCTGYKTLALFVYHTAMHRILWLAMMEVKSESTKEISLFWELFNNILTKIKGKKYKFNPKSIMVDENRANYCTIRKVFGLEFATTKVVSCQMHYKNDMNKASLKIGDNYKGVFKNICCKMCSVTTVAEYNDRKKQLEEIVDIFPHITSWINWWDARKYHIFPAFRQLGYSNVTLAENDLSTLKRHTQLWLLEASQDDTSTMITQIHELEAFLSQQTASSGRGPCSQSCGRADIDIQMCAARVYAAEFNNEEARSTALHESTNPDVFIPSSGERHRPVKTKTSIQGEYIRTKKQKKTTIKNLAT